MQTSRLTSTMAALVGTMGLAVPGCAPSSLSTTTAPSSGKLGPHIRAIQEAPDPSAVIAAYAGAQAVGRGDPAVDHAYLRRMIEFGLPEMAETQARDLLKRDPENGLAWAAVAHTNSRSGQTAAALIEIATAVKCQPAEPFVERTAGQLLAWYDTDADRSQVPDTTRQMLETMRKTLGDRRTFTDAYHKAVETYRNPAGALPSTQPGAAAPSPPPVTTPSQARMLV